MFPKHIISSEQFMDLELLEKIFKLADKFKKLDEKAKICPKFLEGKILATLFYEASTRTRFSFESAMLKLGGSVISTESAGHFSSAIKGESLEDTIKVISGYADIIAFRHPETGASMRASKVSLSPIINAGDGSGEHPTQALLDFYTIKKELGKIDNFKIALVGDLKYGRTIHSLIKLLPLGKNLEIFLISPKELKLPMKNIDFLKKNNIKFSEFDNLAQILFLTDILYMTRIQKERFFDEKLYDKIKDFFILNKKHLKLLKKKAFIMHPLPRVREISPEIDYDHRAAYFRQAKNGLYIRMALLKLLLK